MAYSNKKSTNKKTSTPKTPVATATISNNIATVKFKRAANPLETEFTFFVAKNAFCGDLHNDGTDKPLHDLYKITPANIWNQTNYLFDHLKEIEVKEKKTGVGTLTTAVTSCHIEEDGALTIDNNKGIFAVHLCTKVEQTTIAETARKVVVFYWTDGTTLIVSGKYVANKEVKQNG